MTQIQWIFTLLVCLGFVRVTWSQETPPAELTPGEPMLKAAPTFSATLLLIKSDWSKSPHAKQIEAELREALKDATVPKELLDKLPGSGPEILFAPEIAAAYSQAKYAELLAWLKARELLADAKEFPAPVPQLTKAAKLDIDNQVKIILSIRDSNKNGQLEKNEWEAGKPVKVPQADENEDGVMTREELAKKLSSELPPGSASEAQTRLSLDRELLDLSAIANAPTTPYVERQTELCWNLRVQTRQRNKSTYQLLFFERQLNSVEKARGQQPRAVALDTIKLAATLLPDDVLLINGFPAASEQPLRDAARKKGFKAVIVLQPADTESANASPHVRLPRLVTEPSIEHKPQLNWESTAVASAPQEKPSTSLPNTSGEDASNRADATPTRSEAEFDWAASLLIVEADWSKSESAKEIEADLRKLFAGQVEDEMMENLPKHGAQLLLPYYGPLLYEPEVFDNFYAWLEKHKLVKSVQHGFSFGDYSHIGERIADQTGYPLPMKRLSLFPGGVVDDPVGAAREAMLPFPSLKPWDDGKSDERRLHESNSVHYLWSFGLTRPGEQIHEELANMSQQSSMLMEQVQADTETVSGRRIAISFPPLGSKKGPKIEHDCWFYFPRYGDRVAVIPWFADSIDQQQLAEKAGQVPLLIFHTSKSRMPGFEGWDKTLKKDEPKQWKTPTPGIHTAKSGLPLITRVTSRMATARLLKIKCDWSAVPAAKQIKLEVWDALRDVPVAQELLDKLPASAPEILFAPGIVSLYRGENSGKLLAWLKSKDLLISAERFPPPDPSTVVSISDSSGSSMASSSGSFGGSKSRSGSGSRSGMASGGSSMGPGGRGPQTGMKGRPSPRSPEAASSMDRYALHLTKDGQFIPLPRLSQFTSQPFVKRKPELSWTIISQGGFDNPQIFSRHLAALEELRGEAPRMLQPIIDATSFHFTLPADHAAVMQAFPAASEVAFRDAAREMGFLALIILEGPDIAGVQESTEPQLVLPDKVHTPPMKHEPNLRWGEAGDRAGSDSQVQSTGAPLTKIFHLQHASASGILKILQQLYPTDVKLAEDERTNAIIVSGPEGKLAEMEAIALRLDEAGSAAEDKRPELEPAGTVAELKQQYADAEQEAARLAKESKPAKDKLRAAVAQAFELRQKLLQAELAEFRQRSERIEQSLRQRQGIKQQIIERRVEDLLRPGLEWEGASDKATPHRTPLAGTEVSSQPSELEEARKQKDAIENVLQKVARGSKNGSATVDDLRSLTIEWQKAKWQLNAKEAELELKAAHAAYDRAAELAKAGTITQTELDDAKAALQKAETNVEGWRAQVRNASASESASSVKLRETELKQAHLELLAAEAQYQRSEEAHRIGAITKSTLAKRKLELETARLKVEKAQTLLDAARQIAAPDRNSVDGTRE